MKTVAVVLALSVFPMCVSAADRDDRPIREQRFTGDASDASVKLASPMAAEAALRHAAESGLQARVLESDFTLGERSIHDFYTVLPALGAEGVEAGFRNEREHLATRTGGAEVDSTNAADVKSQPVLVSGMILNGDPVRIERFAREFGGATEAQPAPHVRSNATTMTTVAPATWYPNSGYSLVGGDSSSRYTYQVMRWYNPTFASNQTYERDFFLYNYDRKTYLNGATTGYPGCRPTVTYAATSFPSSAGPYIDTRFNGWSCEIDELAFTIGMAYANQVKANTDYFTYFVTTAGNDTRDGMKLQAQLGYRNDPLCWTAGYAFCSFGYNTTGTRRNIINAWASVPGTISWYAK
jgi:hypothetical protein